VKLLAASLAAAIAFSVVPAHADLVSDESYRNRSELRRELRDQDRLGWYVPDFAKLQTAGFLGMVGLGAGYAMLDDVLNVSLLYGFTPEQRAGDNVHAALFSLDVRPIDLKLRSLRWVPLYVGGGLLYAFGSEYFTRLPERYRRLEANYYPPTALHWTAHLGMELDYLPARGKIERHGLYYEAATVDSYLLSYLENARSLHLVDAFASAIGYRCAF
jgi:hypothetical protein